MGGGEDGLVWFLNNLTKSVNDVATKENFEDVDGLEKPSRKKIMTSKEIPKGKQ